MKFGTIYTPKRVVFYVEPFYICIRFGEVGEWLKPTVC